MPSALLHDCLSDAQEMSAEGFLEAYPHPVLVPLGLDRALLRLAEADRTPLALREAIAQKGPHPLAGRVYIFRADRGAVRLSVGRSADNDLVLPERAASQRHCVLTWAGGGVTALDLGSRNGTFVDDDRLAPDQPRPVRDEAVLSFARYRFQLLFPATFRRMAREVAGVTPLT